MAESTLARLWNSLKPPPAVKRPGTPSRGLRPQQRKLIIITAGVIVAGVAAWQVYAYIAAAPQRAQHEFEAAQKLMAPGNYGKAIDGFTRALKLSPGMAEGYVARGMAYHASGDDEKALADLDQALELNPGIARAYNARGAIYRSRGRVDQALTEYGKSIQAQPNVDAYFERGQLYESLGQHEKAIGDYDQAVAYMRDAPHLYRARAFAKANLGDQEGAQADRDLAKNLEQH
jgi:tetratricopeptide (TPR) repeat protein